MISITTSVSELQKCYTTLDATVEGYRNLVGDLAAHCVVTGAGETESMRHDLSLIARAVSTAPVHGLQDYGPQLREWLAGYGGTVTAYVADLEHRQAAAARAFDELEASLAQADDDHDGRIRSTVDNLRTISRTPAARAIRDVLRNAAESVEQSVEQIRKEHQLTIAQFHTEIRALQRRLDPGEAETGKDHLTRLFTREEIQEKIRSSSAGAFSVVLLRVRGVRLAAAHYGSEVAAQVAAAVGVRLRNLLPVGTAIARWSEEEFVGVMQAGGGGGPAYTFCGSLAEQLGGAYGCLRNGKTVRPSVEIAVCSVEAGARDAPEYVLERVETALMRI